MVFIRYGDHPKEDARCNEGTNSIVRPMARIRVETLASALRELRQKITVIPFDTETSEEMTRLETQKHVDGQKWGVGVVETWSKADRRRVKPEEMWKHPVYFLDESRAGIEVTLKYFMDGIQRTTPIGKIQFRKSSYETVPIHFAQIGIALLKREGRILTPEREEIKLLIEYPNAFVKKNTNVLDAHGDILGFVKERMRDDIKTVDTSYRIARLKEAEAEKFSPDKVIDLDGIKYPQLSDDEMWAWCADPIRFRSQARRWTTRYRDILEQKVYDDALGSLGTNVILGKRYELLVRDGPLTHVRGEIIKKALGVIKTFRTIFLERSQMARVLTLLYGYRSPVFTLTRPDGNPEEDEVYDFTEEPGTKRNKLLSWYLRIRPTGRHDPTWGLLRLEIHVSALPSSGKTGLWTETDTAIVDEISRKVCFEANPSSHPDFRWNNLIYPIKCCESFLRSRIIPHITARYLLGGT